MRLYDHQRKCARAGAEILQKYGLVYLAMQVRTGKTMTALSIAWVSRVNRVLFVTRKGAIAGVKADYELMKADLYSQGVQMFDLYVTNYEQLHNLPKERFDLVVVDEAHNIGTYPKPSLRAKSLKKICQGLPVILLSGTPSPESYSQLFHQFWVSDKSPWGKYKNFYAWAYDYVQVFKRYYGGIQFNDYSRADKVKIAADIQPFVITLSQQQAGITQHVEENILMVQCPEVLVRLMAVLRRDRVVQMEESAILGDTAVKLMSKIHQLSGGTYIDEDSQPHIVSTFKADYIKEKFEGQHIAIFYKFQAEGELLKKVFPLWTDDPQRFHDDRRVTFIRHVVSGREGISLRSADALVMYAIDFSALSYFQSIARIQDIRRDKPALLFWVFTDSPMGFEAKVYEAVSRKKDYTLDYFKKQFNI